MSTEIYHAQLDSRTAGYVYVVSYRLIEGSQAGWQPGLAFLREVDAQAACDSLAAKFDALAWQYVQIPILKFKSSKPGQ